MKGRITILSAAAIGTAATLLSACSGTAQSGSPGLPATGLVPQAARPAGRGAAVVHPAFLPDGNVLYVTDVINNAVEVLKYRNHNWSNIGAITNGISSPYASWVDRAGNLYVSNSGGYSRNVTEYNPAGTLIFTYSTGLTFPAGVTGDRYGNVYATDINADTVSEFPQGVNSAFSCPLPGPAYSVAVDAAGDVFAPLYFSGQVAEFRRGLFRSSCKYQILSAGMPDPLGIAVDRQANLLVSQRVVSQPAIDIIAPPYSSITGTLGPGWSFPTTITFNRAGTQVTVVDSGTVKIVSYPNPVTVTTLGSQYGLPDPTSAVQSSNYVP